MSDPAETEAEAEAETEAETAPAPAPSPLRSLAAVGAGWLALLVLGQLLLGAIAALLPNDVPRTEDALPTERALGWWLFGNALNGVLAGTIVARIAARAPLGHAAAFGGLIGLFGMMSSDQAQGTPWWFAIGRALLPAIGIVVGGAIAQRAAARRR